MINKFTGWECKFCEGKGFILPKIEIDNIESVKRCCSCQKFNDDEEARDFTEEYYYRIDQIKYDL
tara:strand:+ start:2510 stop:2704 length:195 start_codon:yes stop_codon:yes gene_type:complete